MIRVPTPLQQLHHPLIAEKGLTIYVKRDDLTHHEVMGNKWRKLKYNLEEARKQGKRQLLTFGGAYSNHIAATAAAAKLFGFESMGIIRGDELDSQSNPTLRLASENGMKLSFVSRSEFRNLRQSPNELIESKDDVYVLPEGGTNELAIKGCTEIVAEIREDFDLIICPIGTGGTFCGIAKTLKPNQALLGFSALKGYFIKGEVDSLLKKYGIKHKNYVLDTNYHFGGYGKSTSELSDFIRWFEENFRILLDPIYTGKTFFGVWDMVKKNKFEKNLRIVLLHTGGLQGIEGFDRKKQVIVQ